MKKTDTNFPFSLRMFESECRLRGIYLTISCDFENLMSDIIAMCEESNESDLKTNRLKKQPFEMGAKLERCKRGVKAHNENYYNCYMPQFDIIDKLCEHRIMLAHGFSEYDKNKINEEIITFKWIKKDDNNVRFLESKEIIVKPFIMEILTYRNSVFEFMKLHAAISIDKGFCIRFD